jgi:hypothetical protein
MVGQTTRGARNRDLPMQYMLLLFNDPSGWAAMTADQQSDAMGAYFAYTQALREAGVFVAGDELDRAETATTLTMEDGHRRVQDGPFITSKESLGGYYLIEVPDLDAAMDWAAKCPGAHHGHIEIRPVIVHQ